jgi:tetratricopeptide (TPR) repeat protein
MEITLNSNFGRRVAVALELAVFLALLIWIGKTAVADRMAQKPTLQNLRLAAQLDPSNADYHLRLGRLFQYSLADLDPGQATEHFRKAARLSPYNPQPWLDLGAALEFQGKTADAEACLRRADFMAPNLPAFQWAIGNFFLLHGNVDEAFRHFRIVLAGSSQYNQILFSTAWKASGDANKILEQLIPHQVGTEFAYLHHLLGQQLYTEARSVWKRIAGSAETFPPAQASEYIDRMIGAQRPSEAYEAWTDLRKKGLIAATYEATSKNLLMNGAFEERVLNMGFDWRILPLEGVYAGLDQTTFHSASHSLFVQFPGKQNLRYRHVLQYVKVEPGRSYRLRGFMRSEGITTDCGPLLEVRDPYDTRALDAFTESLQGDSMGWIPVSVDFTTGPKTELIAVTVTRLPSRKLDNLIAGKVWVDDLSLTAVSTDTANTR